MSKARDAADRRRSCCSLGRGASRGRCGRGERERIVPAAAGNPGAELLAILLLLAAAGLRGRRSSSSTSLDRLPAHTQLLGLSLGLSFAASSRPR